MTVQRFSPFAGNDGLGYMDDDPDGEWVSLADYSAMAQSHQEVIETALQTLNFQEVSDETKVVAVRGQLKFTLGCLLRDANQP